jgi:hypothetical protein
MAKITVGFRSGAKTEIRSSTSGYQPKFIKLVEDAVNQGEGKITFFNDRQRVVARLEHVEYILLED